MTQMTPRERFYTTVENKEPDRVPIQLGGLATSIANYRWGKNSKYGYEAFCRYVNQDKYEKPIGIWGIFNLDPKVLEKAHSDFDVVTIGGYEPTDMGAGQKKFKEFGLNSVLCGGLTDFPDNLAPFRNTTSIKAIEEYPYWPDVEDPVFYKGVREKAKKVHENTQFVIQADAGFFCMMDFLYAWLRGFDNWAMDPYLYPEFHKALKDKIAYYSTEISKNFYAEVGEYADMTSYYCDLGTMENSFVSPDYYRKWIMPYHEKWIKAVKSVSKAKIWLHSCGAIYDLIPSMIEAGWEILNPLQPLARNMEPWRLKKDFYGKIVLHGGIDLQKLLTFGTVDGIVKEVKEIVRILAPGGGWIAAAANNIPPDVPPENFYAFTDTVYKYGKYPIRID